MCSHTKEFWLRYLHSGNSNYQVVMIQRTYQNTIKEEDNNGKY